MSRAQPLTVVAKDQKTSNEALEVARALSDSTDPDHNALHATKLKKPVEAKAVKAHNALRRAASPLCRTRWELAQVELTELLKNPFSVGYAKRKKELMEAIEQGRFKMAWDVRPKQRGALNAKARANDAVEGKATPADIEVRKVKGSIFRQVVVDVHLEGVIKPAPNVVLLSWHLECTKEIRALNARHFLCFTLWAVRWSRHNSGFLGTPLGVAFLEVFSERQEKLSATLAGELKCDEPKAGGWFDTQAVARNPHLNRSDSYAALAPGPMLFYYADRLMAPSKTAYEAPAELTGSVARKLGSEALENALARFGAEFGKSISAKDQATITAAAKLTEDAMMSVPIGLTRIFELFTSSSTHAKVCSKVGAYTRCAAAGMLLLLWRSELMKCYGAKHPSAADMLLLLL
jgi:hypothetical protein